MNLQAYSDGKQPPALEQTGNSVQGFGFPFEEQGIQDMHCSSPKIPSFPPNAIQGDNPHSADLMDMNLGKNSLSH